MCPCYCCCYLRATSETSALGGIVQLKRLCSAAYPISAARERRSGLNRIGHPDWVKLCVKLNCAPNQTAFYYKVNDYSSKSNNLFIFCFVFLLHLRNVNGFLLIIVRFTHTHTHILSLSLSLSLSQ